MLTSSSFRLLLIQWLSDQVGIEILQNSSRQSFRLVFFIETELRVLTNNLLSLLLLLLSPDKFVILFSSPGGSDGKESACNVGDSGSIPRWGRSPREEPGNPFHQVGNTTRYSCLENPMDRGVWWATVHGVQRVGHDLEIDCAGIHVRTLTRTHIHQLS